MKARTPKGTRDFNAIELAKRHHVTSAIQDAFMRYGYAPLETPSFELSETLMGTYGEEGDRLIFKLLKSGDFLRSVEKGATPKASDITDKALRYDLTVPFARYVVQHLGNLPMPFKRYQIQPVWRADKPQKGRFREFYQCDADVVGSQSLWQEVELINLYADVFETLNLPVVIRLNHRGILSGIAEMAGVGDRLTEFTVALDKLDKIGQEGVVGELKLRGFSDDAIKKLSPALIPGRSMDESLTALDGWFEGSGIGAKGIEDVRFVLQHIKPSIKVTLDISLARGLNYYTGCILEVVPAGIDMGSVGGGGRYDNLTGIFGKEGLSGVGISFGLDRIIMCLEELGQIPDGIVQRPQVLVLNQSDSVYAFQTCMALREAGIDADFYPDPAKMKKQFVYAEQRHIPWVIYAGEREAAESQIVLKHLTDGRQMKVSLEAAIDQLNP